MAVGMVGIGRLVRQTEADQGHHRTGGIGQIVQRVGGDGYGAAENADGELHGKQQDIAENAHSAGKTADGRAALRRVGGVLYKNTQKKIGHNFLRKDGPAPRGRVKKP